MELRNDEIIEIVLGKRGKKIQGFENKDFS